MQTITVTFPDKKKKQFRKGITCKEVADSIGKNLPKQAIAASINGKLADLSTELHKDSNIKIITWKDKQGVEVFRHSTAHVLAHAVTKLYPKALLTIGPVVEEGFYYDIDTEPFSPEDLAKIEEEMQKIVKADHKIERIELTKDKAKEMFKNNPYKLELIEEYSGQGLSAYKQGNFIDLCQGPHVYSTGIIKAFKLTKIAGAYWRGDAKNKQLQRIYGISFSEKKELKEHLKLIEEAEKRDHRKLGKRLDLFSFHKEAPGMPFYHNKGAIIFDILVEFMTQEMRKLGYELNKTPIILNKELWLQSGHWDHYKENMYFTKIDEKDYAVKPMNCPGNILIFKQNVHSYKELPIKAGEFGLVHRHELSGVLSGLFRVRVFTQDDAHIFCTEEQIKDQVIELVCLVDKIYSTFGLKYHIELSTKPEKAMGSAKTWETAEKALGDALNAKKIKFKLNPGDGAFYGPKIDFHVKDAIGRSWQCGTIQLDFSMPEKFDLTYEGKDGKKHRPVMIHRAIYGALERFIAILIEHFAGNLPLWLSPTHARIITVADRFAPFAEEVKKKCEDNNIRVELDTRAESVSYKIREAQSKKIPLMLTIGEKETESKTVAIRTLDGKVKFGVDTDDFISKVKDNIKKREAGLPFG